MKKEHSKRLCMFVSLTCYYEDLLITFHIPTLIENHLEGEIKVPCVKSTCE